MASGWSTTRGMASVIVCGRPMSRPLEKWVQDSKLDMFSIMRTGLQALINERHLVASNNQVWDAKWASWAYANSRNHMPWDSVKTKIGRASCREREWRRGVA